MEKRMIFKEELKRNLEALKDAPEELIPVRAEQTAILVKVIRDKYLLDNIPVISKQSIKLLMNEYTYNEAIQKTEELLNTL